MSEKEIMSEEAMNELINGFEIVGSLTEYGRKNIKYHFQRLQEENKKLQKQFPKIPKKKKKKKLTREEIKTRQELRRAKAESVGLAIMTIFFFVMMLISFYLLYCCLFKGLTF